MKNNFFILIVIVLVIIVALVLQIFSPRNVWLCEGGQWIKRGNPQGPAPKTVCYDDMAMDQEIKKLSILFNQLNPDKQDIKEEDVIDYKTEQETKVFDENLDPTIGHPVNSDLELFAPKSGEIIKSPYQVRGFARGNWFFEATFPVLLTTLDGDILFKTYASAKSDWMTDSMVPFVADLNFDVAEARDVLLVLKKDNPSGLPENDAELSYHITIDK